MLSTPQRALVSLAALIAVVSAFFAALPAPGKPHVIVFMVDTLRADHLGVYGYPLPTSPTLDAFARESLVFERAYAQSSWTRASVGSLFTGLFPSRHGAYTPFRNLRSDVATLAALLRREGYATASFVANPNLLPIFGFGKGFDEVRDIGASARSGRAGIPGARAREVVDGVLDYLDHRPSRPLFLYVHLLDPHGPYGAPYGPFRKAFLPGPDASAQERNVALYDGEIAYVDHHFGRLLERLKADGLYEDAFIFVMSDHGEEFGDHGGHGHGHTLYDELLRVPLILRQPGAQGAGTIVRQPVRLLDVLPTLADELGFQAPVDVDGRSFSGLLSRRQTASYEPLLFAELLSKGHAITSLVEGDRKLIRRRLPEARSGDQVFDLSADPGERVNLAEREIETRRKLGAKLDAVVATLSGGFYFEFHNAPFATSSHRVSGTIEGESGVFQRATFLEASAQRSVDLSEDRSRLRFDIALANQPTSLRRPPFIVDAARLRVTLSAPDEGASLRLAVSVDGEPLPGELVLLGVTGATAETHPAVIRTEDERLRVTSFGALQQESEHPGQLHVRVFSVADGDSRDIEIDEGTRRRLEALGYIGDDDP